MTPACEWYTRPIADMVTGRLDKRHSATHLPGRAEETEACDEGEPPDVSDEHPLAGPVEGTE
jgi:hypothetical protein